ncbi:conserved hypothetical protein [Cupriavidus taiwanensis]|nr:conserved hypothetical protein [Cupriavidus taiwanensis]SPA34877.1 conserved hypothetical protein [Cupriavidus taiwanensis]
MLICSGDHFVMLRLQISSAPRNDGESSAARSGGQGTTIAMPTLAMPAAACHASRPGKSTSPEGLKQWSAGGLLACLAVAGANTTDRFEKGVALDRDLRVCKGWPEALERYELFLKQCLHVCVVQLDGVRVVVHEDQRGEFMMTQHSCLPSYRSILATGLHYTAGPPGSGSPVIADHILATTSLPLAPETLS